MDQTLYFGLAVVLVVIGLFGTVLPAIPGVVLIFAGLALAAWADGFAHVGPAALVIIGVMAALSFVVDFLASLLGAKRLGASPLALGGATVGGIAGLFLGLPGLILGPFVGAALGEYIARRSLRVDSSAASTCSSHNNRAWDTGIPSRRSRDAATSKGWRTTSSMAGSRLTDASACRQNGTSRHARGSFTTVSPFAAISPRRISTSRSTYPCPSRDASHATGNSVGSSHALPAAARRASCRATTDDGSQ